MISKTDNSNMITWTKINLTAIVFTIGISLGFAAEAMPAQPDVGAPISRGRVGIRAKTKGMVAVAVVMLMIASMLITIEYSVSARRKRREATASGQDRRAERRAHRKDRQEAERRRLIDTARRCIRAELKSDGTLEYWKRPRLALRLCSIGLSPVQARKLLARIPVPVPDLPLKEDNWANRATTGVRPCVNM